MEIQMMKQPGGLLLPASDADAERLERFKSGAIYPIEIKQPRNPAFHGKVFAFMQFCFEHWAPGQTDHRFKASAAQFDAFRKELTVLAGYRDVTFKINGGFRVEPKSLSFSNMEQAEFEEFYSAAINAAISHVFNNTTDPEILHKLQSFF